MVFLTSAYIHTISEYLGVLGKLAVYPVYTGSHLGKVVIVAQTMKPTLLKVKSLELRYQLLRKRWSIFCSKTENLL